MCEDADSFFHREVQLLLPFSFHLKGFCFHIWLIPDQSESPNKSLATVMGRVTVSTTCTLHAPHMGTKKFLILKWILAVGSDFKKALGKGVEEKRHDKTRRGVGGCYWSSCYRYRSNHKDYGFRSDIWLTFIPQNERNVIVSGCIQYF